MMPEDDLDAIAGFIWAELANATTDGASEFRHAQLATIGAQGWPQSRTIILRHADNMRREVGFHTDRRSTKAAELAINTSVAFVAYDRPRGLQLRLWGQAELHTENPQAEQVWAALYPPLRAPYRAQYAPGTPLDTPIAANPSDTARNPANPDTGFENFAFVAIRVVRLEWLHLHTTRHRRARFEWAAGWQGNWLAP